MYQITVFLHVLGAIIWLGGILFLAVVAVPVARQLEPVARAKVTAGLGKQFRVVGWTTLAVMLVTGIYAASFRGATWENVFDGSFWVGPFGRTLLEKLVLVAIMAVISFIHDFFLGPAAARAAEAGEDVTALRQRASWLARITALLAIAVVFLAVQLPRPGLLR